VYRQIGVGEVALRALAFTGPNANPMYVNGTGNSVTLLTGPLVGGQCGKADPPPNRVARYPLAPGNMMEDKAACWCCAPQGASCRPSNPVRPRDHVVLAQCFE
jgi:hypothetical protein